jgi:hypothetical protein
MDRRKFCVVQLKLVEDWESEKFAVASLSVCEWLSIGVTLCHSHRSLTLSFIVAKRLTNHGESAGGQMKASPPPFAFSFYLLVTHPIQLQRQ